MNSTAMLSDADEIIAVLEERGCGWSLDHAGGLIEARIWNWPYVIGRYRPAKVEPLAEMLWKAMETVMAEDMPNAEVSEPGDLMSRAIAMEANAELTTVKGLGRRFSWADVVRMDADQAKMFEDHSAPEIPCGCYDG